MQTTTNPKDPLPQLFKKQLPGWSVMKEFFLTQTRLKLKDECHLLCNCYDRVNTVIEQGISAKEDFTLAKHTLIIQNIYSKRLKVYKYLQDVQENDLVDFIVLEAIRLARDITGLICTRTRELGRSNLISVAVVNYTPSDMFSKLDIDLLLLFVQLLCTKKANKAVNIYNTLPVISDDKLMVLYGINNDPLSQTSRTENGHLIEYINNQFLTL